MEHTKPLGPQNHQRLVAGGLKGRRGSTQDPEAKAITKLHKAVVLQAVKDANSGKRNDEVDCDDALRWLQNREFVPEPYLNIVTCLTAVGFRIRKIKEAINKWDSQKIDEHGRLVDLSTT